MPFANDTIKDIRDAVRIADERQFWLFRGDSRHDHPQKLVPKIFREDISKRFRGLESPAGFESEMTQSFANAAPSVHRRCPADGDDLRWLALMQHYGAPTRLLDWSRSILVALFFCVEHDVEVKCDQGMDRCKCDEEDGKDKVVDGEVLAMDAVGLTRFVKKQFPKPWSLIKAAQKLAKQARTDNRSQSRSSCSDEDCCEYALPFGPPLEFPRIMSQLSWFTIHPQTTHEAPIDGLLGEDSLIRYVVLAKSKKRLRESLAALGITRRTLFPDLGGLAESLVSETEREMRARDRSSAGGHDSAL